MNAATNARPNTGNQAPTREGQSGVALLEALIAILIFSLGILTVIAIQATSISMAAEAQYRTKATLLANRLIGEMWASGESIDNLATKFASPSGSVYVAWAKDVEDITKGGLPGVEEGSGDPCAAPANPLTTTYPCVKINPLPRTAGISGTGSLAGDVSVTLYWRTSKMAEGERRQHTVISQISRNP